jgi:UDP-N-acetylglucosamine transferase subunit ALG13
MNRHMDQADLILTHGGTASIIESVKMGKNVVAAARLAKYGEHVDDHQTEIIHKFVQDQIIEGVYEMSELADAIRAARTREHKPYISQRSAVIEYLREIILQDP